MKRSLDPFDCAAKKDPRIPLNLPTVSLCLVVRSSSWISLPLLLLVKGDVIQLGFGEKAPCSVEYIPAPSPIPGEARTAPILRLAKGHLFKPEDLVLQMVSSSPGTMPPIGNGPFYFKLLESPVIHALSASLTSTRPETVIHSQLRILQSLFSLYVVWGVLLCALAINIPRFLLLSRSPQRTMENQVKLGLELLNNLSLYALFPLLPMALPTFFVIARAFGNAQILALYEALQSSQVEEFEDKDDVDEFDVAPPPTKTIVLDRSLVWKQFLDQFGKVRLSYAVGQREKYWSSGSKTDTVA
jgi:hypothetical protein